MDSKKLEQVVDMVDGLKSQAVAVGDFLKHFQNDQECKNNEKSSVSPTLYVKRQFPDTENTACREYYDFKSMLRPYLKKKFVGHYMYE